MGNRSHGGEQAFKSSMRDGFRPCLRGLVICWELRSQSAAELVLSALFQPCQAHAPLSVTEVKLTGCGFGDTRFGDTLFALSTV